MIRRVGGGEFGIIYVGCAVANVIPLDAVIRGCPPRPLQLLNSDGRAVLLFRCFWVVARTE